MFDKPSKFGGSLPAFIAAFTKHQKLTKEDVESVQRMINTYRE